MKHVLSGPEAESLFDQLLKIPSILNSIDRSIDALGMPTWALALVMILALISFVFASREFLAWFLKTNAIADEVIRMESLIRELQVDLKNLEEVVGKTKGLVDAENLTPAPKTANTEAPSAPQFPLHH